MFQHENSNIVILVDAANPFNNLNGKFLLHNIKFICSEIATYVYNFYSVLARLVIRGGLEFTSREGSTQGDPFGMAIYAIRITPIVDMMLVAMQNDHSKMVGFADNVTASRNLEALRSPNYGYYSQFTKSWLIFKENKLVEVVQLFRRKKNSNIHCR